MKVFIVVLHEDYEVECGRADATESTIMGVFASREEAEVLVASKPRVIVDGIELNYASSDYNRKYLIEEWEIR
jgi:hypothetical protein